MALKLKYLSIAACAIITIGASAARSEKPKLVAGVHPVLMSETKDSALLMGGLVNSKWYTAGRCARYPREGLKYRAYDDTKYIGEITGSKVTRDGSRYGVKVTQPNDTFKIAVAGDWNVFARVPHTDALDNPEYIKAIRDILDQKKLTKSAVNITRVQTVDILGDGKKATFITAESKIYNTKLREKGHYSMTLLYQDGASYLIKGAFNLANRKESYPESYTIAGLWDIDGDNTLEIGVGISVPKANTSGIALYDWSGTKLKLIGKTMGRH